MKIIAGIIVVILVLVLVFFATVWADQGYREDIRVWADKNNYEVVSIEECWFQTGPFWIKDKNQRIYKVVLRDQSENKKVSWFRTGIFEMDQAWE